VADIIFGLWISQMFTLSRKILLITSAIQNCREKKPLRNTAEV